MRRPNWKLYRLLLAPTIPRSESERATDAELLHRYVAETDSAAFELLVRRYGDLVFGVCSRVCNDEHDAEDAFQATFLILARKAGSVRRSATLGGWLHRVARRAATEASIRRTKILNREPALVVEVPDRTPSSADELSQLIDLEIDRLPDRLRLPVLLCCLEELTAEVAATRLGIPLGTVLSRLARAREILADRLTRRGVTVPLVFTGIVAPAASASLLTSTHSAVLVPVAGSAAELLSLEILRMTATKTTIAWAAALLLTVGIGTGTGMILAQGGKPGPITLEEPQPKVDPAKIQIDEAQRKLLKVLYANVLKARYDEARASVEWNQKVIKEGNFEMSALPTMLEFILKVGDAHAALGTPATDHLAVLQNCVDQYSAIEAIMQKRFDAGALRKVDLHLCRYYKLEATVRLLAAQAQAAK